MIDIREVAEHSTKPVDKSVGNLMIVTKWCGGAGPVSGLPNNEAIHKFNDFSHLWLLDDDPARRTGFSRVDTGLSL